MTSSLCPLMVGHEVAKVSLLLALMGGVHKLNDDYSQLIRRGQIHILLVGDPGSNKNLLLKTVPELMPNTKCVYGNTVSVNSLIAKMSNTKNSFTLEKESILLADGGFY